MSGSAPAGEQCILVVDDEQAILQALTSALQARGYRVRQAATGQEAMQIVTNTPPDAILLDLALPDFDGVEVCRRIRGLSSVPIIMVSAYGLDENKVRALDQGANDYVTKPYSMPELLARLRAVLRSSAPTDQSVEDGVLAVGDLRIDVNRQFVTVGERTVDLTPKQFAFLALLARHPGRTLTHDTIIGELWGPNPNNRADIQYLRVYASQIRKKLDDDMRNPRLVTDLGIGYRLQARVNPV